MNDYLRFFLLFLQRTYFAVPFFWSATYDLVFGYPEERALGEIPSYTYLKQAHYYYRIDLDLDNSFYYLHALITLLWNHITLRVGHLTSHRKYAISYISISLLATMAFQTRTSFTTESPQNSRLCAQALSDR